LSSRRPLSSSCRRRAAVLRRPQGCLEGRGAPAPAEGLEAVPAGASTAANRGRHIRSSLHRRESRKPRPCSRLSAPGSVASRRASACSASSGAARRRALLALREEEGPEAATTRKPRPQVASVVRPGATRRRVGRATHRRAQQGDHEVSEAVENSEPERRENHRE
jgi:hypothetical protein